MLKKIFLHLLFELEYAVQAKKQQKKPTPFKDLLGHKVPIIVIVTDQ